MTIAAPLLVWSWRTLARHSEVHGTHWPASQRIRALAIGHALALKAGYRVAFYGDDAALRELEGLRWPWELRHLPDAGADRVPEAFWSGSKLVALRDARDREPNGVPVIHLDHDGLVCGPLRDIAAPLYAQSRERRSSYLPGYPNLTEAFGDDLPAWYPRWYAEDRANACGLVGGSSRYAVGVYCDEALRCARLLDERGTLRRIHTLTLEQGVHAALAGELGARVGYALDVDAAGVYRGTGYATWPSVDRPHMPLARLSHHLPSHLRTALDKRFGVSTPHAPPLTPFDPR